MIQFAQTGKKHAFCWRESVIVTPPKNMAFWIQGNLDNTHQRNLTPVNVKLSSELLVTADDRLHLLTAAQLVMWAFHFPQTWREGNISPNHHVYSGERRRWWNTKHERQEEDRREEKSLLNSSLSSTECSPRCFHLPKRQRKSLMCNLWHFMWAIPFWTRPTDSVRQCWRPSELIKFTVKLFGPQAPVQQNVSMMWVGWKYKLLVWLRDEKKLHVDKIRKDCYSLMCTTCYISKPWHCFYSASAHWLLQSVNLRLHLSGFKTSQPTNTDTFAKRMC